MLSALPMAAEVIEWEVGGSAASIVDDRGMTVFCMVAMQRKAFRAAARRDSAASP